MPIQLQIWERRDSGKREIMANTALELCRITRKMQGITSARYYWSGSEDIVFIVEGDTDAFNTTPEKVPADYAKFGFILADHARQTLIKRLMDPKTGAQNYNKAGR